MDQVEACVIGAGVVGLAIGRALAMSSREVFVIDREAAFGQGVSSRNSEVIHAGIYYPKDSLKAEFCVRGKALLYEYCGQRDVGHARCGKLIVATESEEEGTLEEIRQKAIDNGVNDLEYWSGEKLQREEPNVRATLGLYSPSTGIISSHDLMQAYLGDLDTGGGAFIGHANVTRVTRDDDSFIVTCDVNGDPYQFRTRLLVNAAGLGAQALARACDFLSQDVIPPLHYCKGNYFTLSGRNPFRHLIYPVPEKSGAGLGVHATIDLGDQVKFGPDVEYIETEDYAVSTHRLAAYYDSVRRYYPGLEDGQLEPGYVGIRPKLQGPGDTPRDFVIQGESTHGVRGLVQLFGIESPGLTSSLAIADHVLELLPT